MDEQKWIENVVVDKRIGSRRRKNKLKPKEKILYTKMRSLTIVKKKEVKEEEAAEV